MTTIGEEMLLLVLDYDTGTKYFRIPQRSIRCVLGAAVLMDVADAGRIGTDTNSQSAAVARTFGELIPERLLERVVATKARRSMDFWISSLADDHYRLRSGLADRLEERGKLFRGVGGRSFSPGVRGGRGECQHPVRDVGQRLAGELLCGDNPAPRDISIIGLVDARGLRFGPIDDRTSQDVFPMIDRCAKVDLIGQAARRFIQGKGQRALHQEPAEDDWPPTCAHRLNSGQPDPCQGKADCPICCVNEWKSEALPDLADELNWSGFAESDRIVPVCPTARDQVG